MSAAHAVEPSERLANPALEARARAISEELRCLVCQNESIDESGADLAHDIRVFVRERLTAGDTDAQAIQAVVNRYGAVRAAEAAGRAGDLRAVVWAARCWSLVGLAGSRALAAPPPGGRGRRRSRSAPRKPSRLDGLMRESDG